MRFSQNWVSGQKTIFRIKASLSSGPCRSGSGQAKKKQAADRCARQMCVSETCVCVCRPAEA